MARNPKQDANLKPIQKGDLSNEELKKRQRNGGKKSGEVRRAKRDAKKAMEYILSRPLKGEVLDTVKRTTNSDPVDGLTNIEALMARMLTKALSGDLDAFEAVMKYAGFEPEENRRERESIAADKRRMMEIEAKLNTLGQKIEGTTMAINMNDEEGNSDVVVYVPKMLNEEDCLAPDATIEEEPDGE